MYSFEKPLAAVLLIAFTSLTACSDDASDNTDQTTDAAASDASVELDAQASDAATDDATDDAADSAATQSDVSDVSEDTQTASDTVQDVQSAEDVDDDTQTQSDATEDAEDPADVVQDASVVDDAASQDAAQGTGDAMADGQDPGDSAMSVDTLIAIDGGGADSATMPNPCDFSGASKWSFSALPSATIQVSDFTLSASAAAKIEVRHVSEPKRVLYQSPSTGGFLSASKTFLDVHEHQGSFDIKDKVKVTCSKARLLTQAVVGDNLALRGDFEDAEADCKGLTFEAHICQPISGHLQVHVVTNNSKFNRLTWHAGSAADERIYGMGEQFPHDSLNLKGRSIPVIAQEGGVGRGHLPISPAVNAVSKGSAGTEATTYFASPHFLTNNLTSLFVEDTVYAEFDFTPKDHIHMHVHNTTFTGRILHGKSPLELIERFTDFAGRMPTPPSWTGDGAIVALARPLTQSTAIVDDLLKNGVEIAGVWNQTWSGVAKTFIGEQVLWNWTENPYHHPGWKNYVGGLKTKGIRTLCYINSMLRDVTPAIAKVKKNLYAEAASKGYFVKNTKGDVYLLPVTAFDVGLIDLSLPAARTWLKTIIKEEMIKAAGCSGWMADFAEALPFDAVMSTGETGEQWHNRYPVAWAQVNREAVKEAGKDGEILVFHRSGHTKSLKHAIFFWQGDQLTTWDKYDGLVSALHGLINGGLSGISLNHSDIGGYTSLSKYNLGYKRESEQLKRWAEMSAFTALFRTHEGNQPGINAQVYTDKSAMQHFGRMSKVFKALASYRKTLFKDAESKGWPVVRHLALHYPGDAKAWTVDDQFLLGDQFLVAPIKNKCFTKPFCPYDKTLYLPKGEWTHLWSGKSYGSAFGSETVKIKAPIGEPAVFYPKGSAVGADLVSKLKAAGVMK